MVNFQHIPLKIFLGLALLSAGCAMNPFQTSTRAPVEQPAPTQPATPPPKQEKRIEPAPVPESAPAVTTPVPAQELPPYKEEIQELPEEKPAQEKGAPAVVALLDDADRYSASGKKQQAAASLERALRIDPKNPLLWHKLARLRLEEGQWDQALAMAKKSNVLAAGDKKLQSDNWLIIARAREATGDKEGAQQAMNMAQQLIN